MTKSGSSRKQRGFAVLGSKYLSEFVGSDTLSNPPDLPGHSSRTLCRRHRSALRFLHCITSCRLCQELFLKLSEVELFRCSRLSTIPAYLVTLPVVTGRSVSTVQTLYHTFRHLSRRNFRLCRYCSTWCGRLVCGSPVQSTGICSPFQFLPPLPVFPFAHCMSGSWPCVSAPAFPG